MASIPWELEDGLRLVRAISEEVEKFGYQVTLGGSVLHKGKSENDIDVYLLPLERGRKSNRDDLYNWLNKLWGEPENIPEWIPEPEGPQNPLDVANVGPEVAAPAAPAQAWRNIVNAGGGQIRVPAGVAQANIPERLRGIGRANVNRAPAQEQFIAVDNPFGFHDAPKKEKESSFVAKWRFYRNSDKVDIFVVG